MPSVAGTSPANCEILWTQDAEQYRTDIFAYLAEHDPQAALRIDRLFDDATDRLVDFPMLGHPGEIASTREFTPHRRYRLVYELIDDVVLILALIHQARNWPPE